MSTQLYRHGQPSFLFPKTLLPRVFFLALALALAGCGDKEPAQRTAFMAFLKDSVIDAPQVRLDPLGKEQKKAFGVYADHYALFVDFRKATAEAALNNARDLAALGAYVSLAAMAGAERRLRKAAEDAAVLQKKILDLKTKTDAARQRLRQPEDLGAVYALAYERAVDLPARVTAATFAAASEALTASLDLIAFVAAHSRDMEIEGSSINLRNPGLTEDLTARMTIVREKGEALQKAYTAMTSALR